MIFVTVGTVDPFDRLIRAVDCWAEGHGRSEEVIAQIGHGNYQPAACTSVPFLSPEEYRDLFSRARVIVSHAGMGTIITALELGKPLILMPKQASLGEQRNEHQLATARRFRRSERIRVAETEAELHGILDEISVGRTIDGGAESNDRQWPPDPQLIAFVKKFIQR